jgi:hypothetical protein
VFWVLKENTPSYSFLLGDDDKYDFHRGEYSPFALWHSEFASANIKNGTTKLMGDVVNGTNTAVGAGYRLVSVVTDGNVEASRISDDRGLGRGRSWAGDIAEIIIYNRALTTTEENQVGYYLKQKYDLGTTYTEPPRTGTVLIVR